MKYLILLTALITLTVSAQRKITDDTLIIGEATPSDIFFKFDAGAATPTIKWDQSSLEFQIATDGVTYFGLANNGTITSDIAAHAADTSTHGTSGAIVGTTDTQTLTNKTLNDATTRFADNGDSTKTFEFQLDSIATGTNRTISVPNSSFTMAGIANTQTFENKTIVAANNTITTASSGNLAATELNAALDELQDDIDTRATSSAPTLNSTVTVTGQAGVATPVGTPLIHLNGADSSSADISIDAAGASTNINMRRAAGTQASPSALSAGDPIGNINYRGYGATGFSSGNRAFLRVQASEAWDDSKQGTDFVMSLTATGTVSPGAKFIVLNDGFILNSQPSPTTKSGAATLTMSELKTRRIIYTGTGHNLQLPTGTDIEGGLSTNMSNAGFNISVINTGSGSVTLTTNTNLTLTGSMVVPAGESGRFGFRRASANNYAVYRD